MAEINLPSLGQKPWNLNPDITAINDQLESVVDAQAAVTTRLNASLLTTGQETLNRLLVIGSSGWTSGQARFTYFTARKTETITAVRTFTSTPAAGATPSLVRLGLYSVSPDLALIASTPNDTTLYGSTFSGYTKAFSAPVNIVAGTRYALCLLIITTQTAPNLYGSNSFLAAEMSLSPDRLGASITGQSDLPSTVLDSSLIATSNLLYGVLTP